MIQFTTKLVVVSLFISLIILFTIVSINIDPYLHNLIHIMIITIILQFKNNRITILARVVLIFITILIYFSNIDGYLSFVTVYFICISLYIGFNSIATTKYDGGIILLHIKILPLLFIMIFGNTILSSQELFMIDIESIIYITLYAVWISILLNYFNFIINSSKVCFICIWLVNYKHNTQKQKHTKNKNKHRMIFITIAAV